MDHIDQSLDDIIAAKKLAGKKTYDPIIRSKPRSRSVLKGTTTGRISKPNSGKSCPLFTESYKDYMAPVKEIFTSRYLPLTGPIKLIAINHEAIRAKKNTESDSSSTSRSSTTPSIRKGDSYTPSYSSIRSRSPRSVYRSGDYYRPSSSSKRTTDANIKPTIPSKDEDKNDNDANSRSNNQSSNTSRMEINNYGVEKSSSSLETMRTDSENVVKATHQTSAGGMDIDDGPLSIKGIAPQGTELNTKLEGPATIEIENLDPGTTTEDVKVVCSRFGEIRSCICLNGFSQVTYARKAAAQAAVDNLNGKKADNDQILRVTMRKIPVFHNLQLPGTIHVPSPIAGPMKLLTKVVEGTIKNAGTLYQEQLQAAQQMLKVQQHRMAQLHMEEQRIAALRMQANADMNRLSL
ncbi:hypothetical protein BCR41DRAFT_187185 [Lobosporangium transversale]|uniref:RRM domain-containing protein n=1 Tax=Lobosporangium transversale TaxID=64571 RepID=A0A1Y2GAC7_9FUNG|nr:hypothetical protein BCR41DRAFT_187185 [Lobosporangium transversale]ORZ05303.1 hypothetical protein BCR41DRAFT_187185 [Lobosporangium transversale]|eukprot:XP_021876995.1 hypothetical protein BCR41DRAFT_187185 [Lobosporangium transversale]